MLKRTTIAVVVLAWMIAAAMLVSWAWAAEGPAAATPDRAAASHGQATRAAHRYSGRHDARASTVNVMAEIVGLQEACAGDLAELQKRAAATDKRGPADEPAQVRYYTGISHVQHGLLPRGCVDPGADPAKAPPADRWHAEHHLDAAGRLQAIFGHSPAGGLYLTDAMVYHGADPVARLTFGANGFQFGDYGYYRDDRLRLVARIDAQGRLVSYECIAWAGDREDYTVRYVRAGDGADAQRMILADIQTAGGTRLQFDQEGTLTALWAPHP